MAGRASLKRCVRSRDSTSAVGAGSWAATAPVMVNRKSKQNVNGGFHQVADEVDCCRLLSPCNLVEAYNRFMPSVRLGRALGPDWFGACRQAASPAGARCPLRAGAGDRRSQPSKIRVCRPMDTDVRSAVPGTCPRCGMKLVAGIPDPVEFHLDLKVTPTPLRANEPAELTFEVFDPWKDRRVEKFSIVHEKPFHAFVVSRDLQFFQHGHPAWEGKAFRYDMKFPRPGMYRILGDFYPEAATPQLLPKTVFVEGDEPPVVPLTRDYSQKQADNLSVDFSISPAEPTEGQPAQMRFTLHPAILETARVAAPGTERKASPNHRSNHASDVLDGRDRLRAGRDESGRRGRSWQPQGEGAFGARCRGDRGREEGQRGHRASAVCRDGGRGRRTSAADMPAIGIERNGSSIRRRIVIAIGEPHSNRNANPVGTVRFHIRAGECDAIAWCAHRY